MTAFLRQPTGLGKDNPTVDLGEGHWFRWLSWNPDLELNPQYAHLKQLIEENPVVGAIVGHNCSTETGKHEGGIHFLTELTAKPETHFWGHVWTVESWEPLTISPSLQSHCPCSDHGFIKQGKWIRA